MNIIIYNFNSNNNGDHLYTDFPYMCSKHFDTHYFPALTDQDSQMILSQLPMNNDNNVNNNNNTPRNHTALLPVRRSF